MNTAKLALAISMFLVLILLETLLPLFRDRRQRLRHGARNVGIMIFNTILLSLLFSTVYGLVYVYSAEREFGLFYHLPAPLFVRVALLILIFDAWMYVWHRMNHEIPFLWRFHRMHHTDPEMDVTTALRFHPLELIFSSILRVGWIIALGMRPFDILLYETIMLPIIYFHHSNFYLPAKIDRLLRAVIVTPLMHWVHHSDIIKETNSNYGTIFSWWDRLGRTFRLRSDPRTIRYGLENVQSPHWQTIWGMLKTPFVTVFNHTKE
jgi:sterol desaturase/sphingolipid hydroxylase (fatty acid hydroxylase superfamily)